ncbi:MAG: folylpolyglutamate synthase/dihydrofolate synthase family protein [Candidatus Omnitrophota bacterium]
MNYQQTLDYINAFIDYEKKTDFSYTDFKLERVEKLLALIGNPQTKFNLIHVAGTKGKGSTCAFIYNILKAGGYRVGLYTSPHLISFRERIRAATPTPLQTKDSYITDEEFAGLISEISPQIEKLKTEQQIGEFSFFDVLTVIAFMFFAKKRVDYAVLETGLGGRLDATNVVRAQVAVITDISLDHTSLLGDCLEKIAREKSGIIKHNYLVVTAPQQIEVLKVVQESCRNTNSKLYEVGRELVYGSVVQNMKETFFDVEGIFRDNYRGLKIHLLGHHQVVNATAALGAVELLRLFDTVLSPLAIKKGLMNTRWPGRMQVVGEKPYIILDAAQNNASLLSVKKTLRDVFVYNKVIAIVGMSKDKDVKSFLEILSGIAGQIILTSAKNPRAFSLEDLKKMLNGYSGRREVMMDIPSSIAAAKRIAARDDIILITGSCYVLGEAMEVLGVEV